MKNLFIILIALLVRPICADTAPCKGLIDSGDYFYNEFNNAIAFDLYCHAYAHCPQSYEALMKMTRAYIDRGQEIEAYRRESVLVTGLRFTDTLRQRYPDSAQGYFLASVAAGNLCFIRKGARKVALVRMVERNAKKAIELSPGFAPSYVVLGIYYREIAVANPILKLLARLLLGGMPDGTLVESEAALKQALQLSPNNIFALLEMSRTNLLMGKKREAIENLTLLRKSEPAWFLDEKIKKKGEQLLQTITRR